MDVTKARTGTEKKFHDLCGPVVRSLGYLLYDLEYLASQKLLRLYIMDPATKSAVIEDCVKVDNALTPAFESEEWIPEEVVLEVGSPGVYRHVNSLAHFQMGLGEVHEVVITGQLDAVANPGLPKALASAKKFRGELKEATPASVVLVVDGKDVKIPFAQIKKAGLDPDFGALMQKATQNEKEQGQGPRQGDRE